jgi:hypothetical protein
MATGRKEGRKAKDEEITSTVNMDKKFSSVSAVEKARMRRERQAESNKKRRKEQRIIRLQKQLSELCPEGVEAAGKLVAEDDDKSAYRMLQDMRSIYKSVDGKKKLQELIKSDDKQFVFMVKELMKIEAQLMSAKIKAKEGPGGVGNVTTFVIIKGLEDEKKIIELSSGDMVSGKNDEELRRIEEETPDIGQALDAINPSAEPKIEYTPEIQGPVI